MVVTQLDGGPRLTLYVFSYCKKRTNPSPPASHGLLPSQSTGHSPFLAMINCRIDFFLSFHLYSNQISEAISCLSYNHTNGPTWCPHAGPIALWGSPACQGQMHLYTGITGVNPSLKHHLHPTPPSLFFPHPQICPLSSSTYLMWLCLPEVY